MHEPRYLRVRNWERYQVYHDGRPTKFFSVQAVTDPKTGRTGILDDPAFLRLLNDPECPVFLVMAYAAQTGNKIPNDPVFLRAKLLTEFPVNVGKMLESRFLEPWKPEEEIPANEGCTDPYEIVPREEKNREEKKPPLPPLAADAAKDAGNSRPRDELWDALTAELGSPPATRSERGRWNKAVKELREAGATPADVKSRCVVYRRRWPGVSLTPTALSSNWGSLAAAAPKFPCPECGVGFRRLDLLDDHLANVHGDA